MSDNSLNVQPSPQRPPVSRFARSAAPSAATRIAAGTATLAPSDAGESSSTSNADPNETPAGDAGDAGDAESNGGSHRPSGDSGGGGGGGGGGGTDGATENGDDILMMQVRAVKRQQSELAIRDIPPEPHPAGNGGGATARHNVSFVSHGFTAIGDKVKELNDTLAELQALGIQHVTNLPELVLVGDQSAGKSSLMSSFSGLYLPRSEGACTRCPVHIRLSASPAGEPWKCQVSLQQDYDYDGSQRNVTLDHPFGPWKSKPVSQRLTKEFASLLDPSKIEETLRWAQIATLNPDHEHTLYRPGTGDIWRRHHSHVDTATASGNSGSPTIRGPRNEPPILNQAGFSPNTVALQITAPDLTDLSFYDLPGVFTSARQDEDQYLVKVVENLAAKYIAHKQAIILWAVPMNADPETSSTFSIIRRLQAQSRTIGVMTKADLLPRDPGASSQWMAMLRGEQHAVSHGYFMTARPIVTQNLVPDDLVRRSGSSNGDTTAAQHPADDLERQGAFEEAFFNKQLPGLANQEWPSCFREFEARCGVGRLVSYMSQQLGKEFANCLPQIKEKVLAQLDHVEDGLSQLPDMPLNPELGVRRGLSDFANRVRLSLEGADLSPQLSAIMQRFQGEIVSRKPLYIVAVSSNQLQQPPSSAAASVVGSPFRQPTQIDLTMDDDNASVLGAPTPSVNGRTYNVNGGGGGPVGALVSPSGGGPGGSRRRRQRNDFLEGRADPSTPSKRSRGNGSNWGIKTEPSADYGYGFSPGGVHTPHRNTRLFPSRNAVVPPPPAPKRTLLEVRDIISAKSQPGMPNIVAEDVYNFLSMEAVAPWQTYVGQLVKDVFGLLAWKLDELLCEALSGLRGRLIVTKSQQLLRAFLADKEQALRETLLRQCRLESRKLYTLNEETLKRYREEELRLLSRNRHHQRMKAYLQQRSNANGNGNGNGNGNQQQQQPPERAPPKNWEDMVDEERAREKAQMAQEMAKLGPEPFAVELEVCAYVRAYYRTASVRFVDTCTLQVVSGLIGEIVEALADQWYLDVHLGLVAGAGVADGAAAVSGGPAANASNPEAPAMPARTGPTAETFLALMEEDATTARRRATLKEERERYLRTIESIQRLGDHHLGYSQEGSSSYGTGPGNGHGMVDDEDEWDGPV